MTRGILENLAILFLVAFASVAAWWGLVRLTTWSTGTNIRAVQKIIYSDPRAAADYRGKLLIAIAIVVSFAMDRFV